MTGLEDCYGNLVNEKIKALRKEAGWTMEELAERIRQRTGMTIATSTLYCYERPCVGRNPNGTPATGHPLPLDMIPVIASVYGYETPNGWLPRSFPVNDAA